MTTRVQAPGGPVVVATAISRSKHDEALRELLLQLAIADLATLAAASLVGYGTARAALNPVERYRRAAANAQGAPLLPVQAGKDDEVTRLGHTFNALLERIGQANERERQFLADASHELRSPLALMRTELEVALLRPRDAAYTRVAFESLRAQVERLIALSNAVLDLEELRGLGPATLRPVDLDRVLTEVVGRYEARARGEGRTIRILPLGAHVLAGHQDWLDLAVDNLVSNALRYGRGTITVSADDVDGRVRLAVSDEGPGFPADFVDKAFHRFSRADSSRATKGTGLGLALVRAVAEAHAGTATITPPSTVTIELPQPPSNRADGGRAR